MRVNPAELRNSSRAFGVPTEIAYPAEDLIDHIKTRTDAAGQATVDQLATAWLRALECPVDYTTLCPN